MTVVHPTMYVSTDLNGVTCLFTPRNKRGATSHSSTGKAMSFENVPLTGFRIIVSEEDFNVTKRQPTVNILDPRGFIIRCNTTNIFQLMLESTVIDGIIIDECVWAVRNGVSLLMKNNSKRLEEALKPKTYIRQEDVPIGNIVTLKNGTELQYVGNYGFYVDTTSSIIPLYNQHAYYELEGKDFSPKHVVASNKFNILRHRSPNKKPVEFTTTKGTYFKLDGKYRYYNVVSHSPNLLLRDRLVTKPISDFKMEDNRKALIEDHDNKISFFIMPSRRKSEYITAFPQEYGKSITFRIFDESFDMNTAYRISMNSLPTNTTFTYIEYFLEDENGMETIV